VAQGVVWLVYWDASKNVKRHCWIFHEPKHTTVKTTMFYRSSHKTLHNNIIWGRSVWDYCQEQKWTGFREILGNNAMHYNRLLSFSFIRQKHVADCAPFSRFNATRDTLDVQQGLV